MICWAIMINTVTSTCVFSVLNISVYDFLNIFGAGRFNRFFTTIYVYTKHQYKDNMSDICQTVRYLITGYYL